jgi:hypothetical protein
VAHHLHFCDGGLNRDGYAGLMWSELGYVVSLVDVLNLRFLFCLFRRSGDVGRVESVLLRHPETVLRVPLSLVGLDLVCVVGPSLAAVEVVVAVYLRRG